MSESRPVPTGSNDADDCVLISGDADMNFNINHDWDKILQGADTSQFTSLNEYFVVNDPFDVKQDDFLLQTVSNSTSNPVQDYLVSTEGLVMSTQQPNSRVVNQDWEGMYKFGISFAKEGKLTNGTDWTFSAIMNKLYVNMDASCPVQFHLAHVPPAGSVIRAIPAFLKPKHTSEVVQRCLTHRDPKDPSNVGAPDICEHLIRCEDNHAKYHCEVGTERRTVTVPYYPPLEGMDYIYYVYKFMCFCSCMGGGISKRPLQIIFTLEYKGEVLGRKILDIRICASPGRDRKTEESRDASSGKKCIAVKRSLEVDRGHCSKTIPGKKSKASDEVPVTKKSKDGDDIYILQVRGKKNFKTLKYLNELMQFRDAARSARDEDDSS